jgi:hypothetical protein
MGLPLLGAIASGLIASKTTRDSNAANEAMAMRIARYNNRNVRKRNRFLDKRDQQRYKTSLKMTKSEQRFARKSYRQQVAFARKQYRNSRKPVSASYLKRLGDNAEAAGINRFAAMMGATGIATPNGAAVASPFIPSSTGGGAYQPPVAGAAPPLMSAPYQAPDTALSDTVSTAFQIMADQPDPEREALEKAVLAQELQNLQNQNKDLRPRHFGYSIPQVVNQTGIDHGPASQNNPQDLYDRNPIRSDLGNLSRLNTPLGQIVTRPDIISDAEDYEQRYGDLTSSVIGVGALLTDLGTQGAKASARGAYRGARATKQRLSPFSEYVEPVFNNLYNKNLETYAPHRL